MPARTLVTTGDLYLQWWRVTSCRTTRVLAWMTKDEDFGEEEARLMLVQVEGRDYSPPRRDRILQWQSEQGVSDSAKCG